MDLLCQKRLAHHEIWNYFQSITMFATRAPIRVCRAYCGKYCEGSETWAKSGACVVNIVILVKRMQ